MANGARTRLLSMAVLALVFVSGLLVGVAVDRRATAGTVATETREGGSDERDEVDDEGRRVPMYERVGLKPGQEERIDSIIRHHRAALRALETEFEDDYQAMRDLQKQFRDAYNPRYWAIIDSTRAAIKAVFDAEQAARYDSLVDEYDRRRRTERSDTTGR
jgi:hypothetical protein